MGDVAGIGPEIIALGWPHLLSICQPIVIGDLGSLLRARGDGIPVVTATNQNLSEVRPGYVSAAAGRAAYDFLCHAIDHTLAGEADAIVTCPLHKEGLHAAGIAHPGHTEILAERTQTKEFAMVLYGDGVAVAHVTLHMSLRQALQSIHPEGILEKIRLLNGLLPGLSERPPRIAVAALNPHAGDGGLFGDEEERVVKPAVRAAQAEGINVSGPLPADTLFVRAHRGDFDGVVALYHDQGHIAMKLRSGWRCVNITCGLPIIRTSVAHGTAYDIAGRRQADPASLIEAVKVAAKLAAARRATQEALR
jgi:4-hydroxythreonine-4-phosphate dehydrogenase